MITEATIIFGLLFLLLATGMWVPGALAVSALAYLIAANGIDSINLTGNLIYNSVNSFTLSAIPLFVFMGELVLRSNMMSAFYISLSRWMRRLPGGLLHSNIAASSIMAAITGSSVATAASIGSVAIPELKSLGYPKRKIYGSLAAGGTLGILIPPSIIMIIYGSVVQESVAVLFVACIVPGVLAALLFSIYIAVTSFRGKRDDIDVPSVGDGWTAKLKGLADIMPIVLLMAVIIGFIYFGVMSPSEAGAIGAAATMAMLAVYRRLSWAVLKQAMHRTVSLSCMVLFIVMSAALYSYALVDAGITRSLSAAVIEMGLGKWALIFVISLVVLVLGMFIDGVSIIYLTLPLLLPILIAAEIDLVWFGVILVLLIEIGLVTPPMGLNLFVIQSLDDSASMQDVIVGVLPYIMLLLTLVGLIFAFPEIALWLPTVGMR